MKDRENILPAWLQDAGYTTALIGKWLNGYGARDAHGEVPKGFDIWRGLLDVSAYDYSNFVMNADGKLRSWGDADFARKLVEFANIEVTTNPAASPRSSPSSRSSSARGPTATGAPRRQGLLTRRDRQDRREARPQAERPSNKPFFIWWSPAAPHREDVATTLMGRPGPDPRPAPRYSRGEQEHARCRRPPNFNEADITDKSVEPAGQGAAADDEPDRAAAARLPGPLAARCWPSTTTSPSWSRPCARPTSSRTR